MSQKRPANPERSFGVAVGTVLTVIASLQVWRGRLAWAEVTGGIGIVLLVLGLVRPSLLRIPSAIWWRFARLLAYVNARIILTLLFVLVLTPMSLLWRLMRRDPLNRSRAASAGWSPYPARYRDVKHYERMF